MCVVWKNGLLLNELIKRGWTGSDLARAAGLSKITVLKCLKKDAKANIPTVTKIAKALNLRGETLIEWR